MNRAVSRKDIAVNRMIVDYPFFAHILLQKKLEADMNIPTACVNARGNIRYNPMWFDTLTIDEIVFVLAHEVMHYLCLHTVRRNGRHPFMWNYAGDGHINDILQKSNVGAMPEEGVRWKDGAELTTEAIYDAVVKDLPEPPPPPPQPPCEDGDDGEDGDDEQENDDTSSGGEDEADEDGDDESSGADGADGADDDKQSPGGGDSAADDDAGGEGGSQQANGLPMGGIGLDLDESEELSDAEVKDVIEQVRLDTVQAETAARQMGKMPGPLVEFAKRIVHVRTPWWKIMERFATASKPNDITFENLDRRLVAEGIYMPFESGQGMDEMALIIDASGSTRRWWDYFGGHLNKVLETVKPSKLHVVYTTIAVDRVDTLSEDEYPVEIGIDKTGGTHMPAGVEYVEDNLPNVCCMIVLTDGETDWGHPSSIPVLWAITQKHITAPHGETLHVIKEEDEI